MAGRTHRSEPDGAVGVEPPLFRAGLRVVGGHAAIAEVLHPRECRRSGEADTRQPSGRRAGEQLPPVLGVERRQVPAVAGRVAEVGAELLAQ